MLETMGWISIVPVALAVILAFATRNTIASLATACILGCFLAGKGIFGFTDLLKTSLGNFDSWNCYCVRRKRYENSWISDKP